MEAMAIEGLLLSNWRLDGYLGATRIRVPPPEGGHWREIDAVAVGLEDGRRVLRIGEVKVRGTARQLYRLQAVNEWINEGTWAQFIGAVAALYHGDRASLPGLPSWNDLDEVQIEFVVNGWVADDDERQLTNEEFERTVQQRLAEAWNYTQTNPAAVQIVHAKLRTSLELILDTIAKVRNNLDDHRGCRYGDPVLDTIREILRYTINPGFLGIQGTGMGRDQLIDDHRTAVMEALWQGTPVPYRRPDACGTP